MTVREMIEMLSDVVDQSEMVYMHLDDETIVTPVSLEMTDVGTLVVVGRTS